MMSSDIIEGGIEAWEASNFQMSAETLEIIIMIIDGFEERMDWIFRQFVLHACKNFCTFFRSSVAFSLTTANKQGNQDGAGSVIRRIEKDWQ
jgi:hypothetical protein